jgi:hypothetical protein
MVGICKSRYLKKNIELLTSTPPIIKKTTTAILATGDVEEAEKLWG